MEHSGMTKTNTLAELIKARRTVRVFKSDPVAEELLLNLLNVATWAPTHGLREPWRFILYKDEGRMTFAKAVMDTLSYEDREKHGQRRTEYYMGIPVHLIVVLREDARQKQWDEDFSAVCCLIQNFQLDAWEQGLGVVWKSNPYMYDPDFRKTVDVRPGEKIVGVLHVGYPEIIPPARSRTAAEELLTIVDFA